MDKLVEVKPTELHFTVVPGVQSTATLRLRSLVSDALLLKFKTTAPLRYAVPLNASVILPGATADITVVLKVFNSLPPEMVTRRDKLMLEIAPIDPDSAAGLTAEQVQQLWRSMLPEAVVRKKFPCRLGMVPVSPIPEGDEDEAAAGGRRGAAATGKGGGEGGTDGPPRLAKPTASMDGGESGPTSHRIVTFLPGQDDLAVGGAAAAGATAAAASDSDADVLVTEEEVEEEEEIVDDGPSSVARLGPASAPSLPETPATLIGARASRDRAWENVVATSPTYQATAGGAATPASSRPPPSAAAFPDAPTFPSLSAFTPPDALTPVMPPPLSSGDIPTPTAAEAVAEGDEPAASAPPETAAAKLFVAISSTILATVYRAQEMLAKRKDAAAAAKAKKAADAAAATPIPPPRDALSSTPAAPSAPSRGAAASPPPASSSSTTTAADVAPSSTPPGGSAGPLRKGGFFLRAPPPSSIPPLLVSPAPAPVPREAPHRAAVARASSAAAALRETEATIAALRADLEAAKHRKADAADAVRPLYAARFAVATDAPAPFVDVALMLIITAGLVKLTFLPASA